MSEHATRIGLNRHAWFDNAPEFSKPLGSFFSTYAAAVHCIKSPGTVQSVRIGGNPARRHERSSNAVFRGTTIVERLGHRAGVPTDACGKARRDAEAAAQAVA